MPLRELFGLGGWKPDLERDPPPKDEWPTYVKHLDKSNFHDFIEGYPVSLIDFYSPHCKPCKVMSPRIRKLSKRYKHRAVFGKVNLYEHKELGEEYDIISVPKFIIFSYGEKVKSLTGKRPMGDIKTALDDVLETFEKS